MRTRVLLAAAVAATCLASVPHAAAALQYQLTDLDTLGGTYSSAYGISASGQVVGQALTTGDAGSHAFLYDGTMHDLGTLGGTYSSAQGINASGLVVGGAWTTGDAGSHAFLYDGTMHDLGTLLGGTYSSAQGINASGLVVGNANTSGQDIYGYAITHAFLYDGTMHDLGALGRNGSYANGINASGQVVGSTYDTGQNNARAFLYSNGQMKDLNGLLTPAAVGYNVTDASAINDAGQIAANATTPTGPTHAVLLTPVGNASSFHATPEVTTNVIPPTPDGKAVPRLAQWKDGQWQPIDTHAVPNGNVHVLIHGWEPGEKTWITQQEATDSTSYHQSTYIWNDPNASVFSGFSTLAAAMATADPGSTVLAFSWLDFSATDSGLGNARQSRAGTDAAAQLLSHYLQSALPADFSGKLQLFGHSHGARVAALAVNQLAAENVSVDQLTLADSPDVPVTGWVGARNNLSSVLQDINIGRTSGTTFVDNYVSDLGRAYRIGSDPRLTNIVDVTLQPNTLDDAVAHGYPISWYAKATNYPGTQDGLAWSPAVNSSVAQTLESSYSQDWQNQAEYETRLLSTGGTILNGTPNLASLAVRLAAPFMSAATSTVVRRDVSIATLLSSGSVSATGGDVLLSENGNAIWHGLLTTQGGDDTLNFRYLFLNTGDGDQLGIWIDDTLEVLVTGVLAGNVAESSNIDLSDLTPGDHILSFGLYSYGQSQAVVDVSNLSIDSVPEPGSLALLGVASLVLFRRRHVAVDKRTV